MFDDKFVNSIAALAATARGVQFFEKGGRHYTDKPIQALQSDLPTAVDVDTLRGLVRFIEQAKALPSWEGNPNLKPEERLATDYYLHVADHETVHAVTTATDNWGRRITAITASVPDGRKFQFEQWLSQEQFIIGLLALVVPSPERDELITFASKVASVQSQTSEDNGVSQEVHLKRGAHLLDPGATRAPGRVKLAPYRTFREIDQPESEFVFRIKPSDRPDTPPTLALFEADGGAWKVEAMERICKYLDANQNQDLGLPVVA